MADSSIDILDAAAVSKSVLTDLTAGVHTPKHIVASSALPSGAATQMTLAAVLAKMGALLAAGADAISNTQDRGAVASFLQLFNGTTWDRARGDTTNGLWVNIKNSGDLTAIYDALVETPATGSNSIVASSAMSVTLLASNSARVNFSVRNGADKAMYLAFGEAATTSHCVKIEAGGFYEEPTNFKGNVLAIWDSGPTGNALVREMAA